MKAVIVYWTGSGNTQIMADSIQEAIEDMDLECEYYQVSETSAEEVKDADIFFLGSPAMNDENVEEYEFRPFQDDLNPHLSGKKVVMFGSYDWGEAEWMENWKQEMNDVGAQIMDTFVVQWEPNDDQLKEIYDKTQEIMK